MRVPVLSYFGGLLMSQLSWNLKVEMNGVCLVSLGKLFHALIIDGKKEIHV